MKKAKFAKSQASAILREFDAETAIHAAMRLQVLPAIERSGVVRARIVDDTAFPKKAPHRVGPRNDV